jgi:3-deoxy-D-arabino-heptulosonate 7-phosphate (DAHP) synthase class II
MLSNNCPTSTISGYQFNTHYDCVNAGYAIAQSTFRNLKELEEWDREYLEQSKIVVKFECKELKVDA